jgi:predicted dithiol-disulfide oxidoreductase (DUF899 family)
MKPSVMADTGIRFPNESEEYRKARDELLAAEIALRAQIEAVAAQRRRLPLGGAIPEDYAFEEGPRDLAGDRESTVKLSELFGDKPTLVLYNFMYSPKMKEPCSMCTSFLDALNGNAMHLEQRVALAVVARSPIGRIRGFARRRGWKHLRLLSSGSNAYNAQYGGELADGSQQPMLNVFAKKGGAVHHVYGSELFYAAAVEGQDPRHNDLLWPLWNALDLTPEGRGSDWYPALSYE